MRISANQQKKNTTLLTHNYETLKYNYVMVMVFMTYFSHDHKKNTFNWCK